jgi:hypothetical protein
VVEGVIAVRRSVRDPTTLEEESIDGEVDPERLWLIKSRSELQSGIYYPA